MSRGRYEKAVVKGFPWGKLAAVVLLALALGTVALCTCGSEQEIPVTDVAEKNPDSIAIPGYEALELKADSKKQSLALKNPEQNMCYFQISLYLEDGTLLWQSELIEPGAISKPMTLTQELEKGTYPNALLRYACYRMDETLTPLNGAEMKVTLWVKDN